MLSIYRPACFRQGEMAGADKRLFFQADRVIWGGRFENEISYSVFLHK